MMKIPDSRQARALGGATVLVLGWGLLGSDHDTPIAAQTKDSAQQESDATPGTTEEPASTPTNAPPWAIPGTEGGAAGLAALQGLLTYSELEKALQELEEQAESLALTDAARAVQLLEKRASHFAEGLPMTLQMRRQRVEGQLKGLKIRTSAKRLAKTAQAFRRVGEGVGSAPLGSQSTQLPPDPALHRRYLAAKRAYDSSSR